MLYKNDFSPPPKIIPVQMSLPSKSSRYPNSVNVAARIVLSCFLTCNVLNCLFSYFGVYDRLFVKETHEWDYNHDSLLDRFYVGGMTTLRQENYVELIKCSAFSVALEVLALIGNWKKFPCLYWPYLVQTFIQVIVWFVISVGALLSAVYAMMYPKEWKLDEDELTTTVLCLAFIGLILSLYAALMTYYGLIIVNRSRKSLARNDFGIQ